jgi:hypothetical protein
VARSQLPDAVGSCDWEEEESYLHPEVVETGLLLEGETLDSAEEEIHSSNFCFTPSRSLS